MDSQQGSTVAGNRIIGSGDDSPRLGKLRHPQLSDAGSVASKIGSGADHVFVAFEEYEADGITRRVLDSYGITRRVLEEYGITRRVLDAYGITRRVLEEYGVSRRVLDSYFLTLEILEPHGITRRVLDDYGNEVSDSLLADFGLTFGQLAAEGLTVTVLDEYGVSRRVLDDYTVADEDLEAALASFSRTLKLKVRIDAARPGMFISLGTLPLADFLDEVADDSDIAFVELDVTLPGVSMGSITDNGNGAELTPWGISHMGSALEGASGVHVYVLDSGLNPSDVNAVERKDFSMLFVNRDETNWDDSQLMEVPYFDPGNAGNPDDATGHGTHIAGTIGALQNNAQVVGAAPGAKIHSLRVMSDQGQTDITTLLSAIDYVIAQKIANPVTPMVLNMSLGMDIQSTAYNVLDEGVKRAIENGIVVVVSAGNDGANASTYSPGHVSEAITVAAHNQANALSSFSNFGTVVDLVAPGEMIPSASSDPTDIASNFAVVESGTSMAAAHATGAAAAFLQDNPTASPEMVKDALIGAAMDDLSGTTAGTPNKRLWMGGALDNVDVPPFFQFAVSGGNTLEFKGGVHVGVEAGLSATQNASVYSTGDLKIQGSGNLIEGFGYHKGSLDGPSSAFQPAYNPANDPVHSSISEIEMPYLNADSFSGLATQYFGNSLFLSGDYALGTCLDPAVWYVNGTVETNGPVTFSGYGIIISTGDVKLGHDVFTAITGHESQVGLYSEGKLETTTNNVDIAAQVYTNGTAVLENGTRIMGSIVTQGGVDFKGDAEILYRPAAPALTEPIWPVGNWDGSCPQIDDSGTAPDLTVANVTVDEEAGQARLDLQLSFATSMPVTLNYATTDGTAEAGRDYTAKSGSLTIQPGADVWTLFVPIQGENVYEAGPESFTMQFSNGQNVNLVSTAATVTIEDNDPVPSIRADNRSFNEGAGSGSATFSLSNPSQFPISFDYGTSSGTAGANDYSDVSGSITIEPYANGGAASIPVMEDPEPEATETLTMAITNPQGATIADASGTLSIVDNEPSVRIHNKSVDEQDGSVSIRVSLTHASPYTTTTDFASSDGTAGTDRYDATSGTLTFAPGQTEKYISTGVHDNNVPDADRHFTVALNNVTNAHVGDGQATVTLRDDEPVVSIADASTVEGGSMSFTVTLSRTSLYTVSVGYNTQDATAWAGDDYQSESGSLTFHAGQTSKTVTVSTVNDTEYEGPELFTMLLSNAQAAHLGDNGATGTIQDDDPVPTPGGGGGSDPGNGSGSGGDGAGSGNTAAHLLDTFSSISFSGNDGAQTWQNDWQELGESNGPTRGKTRVRADAECAAGNCARFTAKRGGNDGLSRTADLSGASSATLTLYARSSDYSGADAVLQVSNGSGWTTLHTFASGSTSGQTLSFDISAFASSSTQIRVIQQSSGSGGFLYVDDVEITSN